MKKFLMASAVVLALTGCSTQQFTVTGNRVPTVPAYEGTSHFIFWGLGQTKVMDPKEICNARGGIRAIETRYTFIDGVASALTWGIYSPHGYAIYCNR